MTEQTIIEGRAERADFARPAPARNVVSRVYHSARDLVGPRSAEVIDIDHEADLPAAEPQRRRRFSPVKISFLLAVILPTLGGILYYAFLASDQFTAELRLVVRNGPKDLFDAGSSTSSLASAAASMNSSSSSSTSTEDAFIVASYIRSRTMVEDLSRLVNLHEIFRRPEADLLARLKKDPTAEELHEYWLKMVGTAIDQMSGIVTVTVRAFRPDDAVAVLAGVETLSEKLVNDLSTRARTDTLSRAAGEVARAQDMMRQALVEMERFRNQEGLLDPVQAAGETGKILATVLGDQLAAENQLFVATRSLDPSSPSVRSLQTRVEGLRRQVSELRAKLAGSGGGRNVAATLVRFEEISVKQKLAESLYTLAERGLDRARRTAEAQSVYLSVFVKPSLPEEYSYPRRFAFPILIAVACLVLWGIFALIAASIQDHRL